MLTRLLHTNGLCTITCLHVNRYFLRCDMQLPRLLKKSCCKTRSSLNTSVAIFLSPLLFSAYLFFTSTEIMRRFAHEIVSISSSSFILSQMKTKSRVFDYVYIAVVWATLLLCHCRQFKWLNFSFQKRAKSIHLCTRTFLLLKAIKIPEFYPPEMNDIKSRRINLIFSLFAPLQQKALIQSNRFINFRLLFIDISHCYQLFDLPKKSSQYRRKMMFCLWCFDYTMCFLCGWLVVVQCRFN